MFSLVEIAETLPADVQVLRNATRKEGHRFIDRLCDDWLSGKNTFSKDHEILLLAYNGNSIAGVGGLTHDPVVPNALRMRRFYVLPQFRRMGLAKQIVDYLLERAVNSEMTVTENAGTKDAPAFWEAIGFSKCVLDDVTHVYDFGQS